MSAPRPRAGDAVGEDTAAGGEPVGVCRRTGIKARPQFARPRRAGLRTARRSRRRTGTGCRRAVAGSTEIAGFLGGDGDDARGADALKRDPDRVRFRRGAHRRLGRGADRARPGRRDAANLLGAPPGPFLLVGLPDRAGRGPLLDADGARAVQRSGRDRPRRLRRLLVDHAGGAREHGRDAVGGRDLTAGSAWPSSPRGGTYVLRSRPRSARRRAVHCVSDRAAAPAGGVARRARGGEDDAGETLGGPAPSGRAASRASRTSLRSRRLRGSQPSTRPSPFRRARGSP